MYGVVLLANFMVVSSPSFTGEVRSAIIQRGVEFADLDSLTEKARARKTRLKSEGSGFFISSDGTILTNHHVVDGAEELVAVWSNTAWRVKVTASDSKADLAILELDGCPYEIVGGMRIGRNQSPDFPFLAEDSAGQYELGDTVYAIGYPELWRLGMEVKVTRGITSSLTGSMEKLDMAVRGDRFQIDAAIHHGNSGGPVVDERGRLVGVCVAGFGSLQNVNYAIKVKTVRKFLDAQKGCGSAVKIKHSVVRDFREATKSSVLILKYVSFLQPLPFDDETRDARLRTERRACFEKTILYAKLLKVKKEWKDLKKVTDSLINEYGEDVSGGEIKELNELAKKELGIEESIGKNKENKK